MRRDDCFRDVCALLGTNCSGAEVSAGGVVLGRRERVLEIAVAVARPSHREAPDMSILDDIPDFPKGAGPCIDLPYRWHVNDYALMTKRFDDMNEKMLEDARAGVYIDNPPTPAASYITRLADSVWDDGVDACRWPRGKGRPKREQANLGRDPRGRAQA